MARGGCLAKLDGCRLRELLDGAYRRAFADDDVANPMIAPEDSAVIDIGANRLLATTEIGRLLEVDPIVAGRIAALNAMSDIYASGGVASWALALLVLDGAERLAPIEDALVGMLAACRDEGVQVVGGHTMVGTEPLLGLTVIGQPRCEPPLRKRGARSGDLLFLSKPVGSALTLHAHGLNLLERDSLDESLSLMQLSNRHASEIAVSAGASAATDVTGFGLLGHLVEMLSGSLGAELRLSTIPTVGVVRGLPAACAHLESLRANLAYARDRMRLTGLIEATSLAPLLAPETNGPLLVAAPESAATLFARGGFTQVGRVTSMPGIHIHP